MQISLARERLTLGPPLHRGAAGSFHPHPNNPLIGIKIYFNPEDVEIVRLEWLRANPPPNLTELGIPTYAWPLEIAYDEATGDPVGFSMARAIDVLPLQAIVDPASRPAGISPVWLWKVAISFTKRIQALHLASPPHVVGDINFHNTVVHRSGLVTQLDCDSTHFTIRGGRTFTCNRCRPELQPPELVSTPTGVLERFQHQDAFTTFIVVHRLIRDGLHPFHAHYVGGGDPLTLTELIQQGIWPDSQLHQDYRPIPGVPLFASLPGSLQDLFRRMFQDGAFDGSRRPDVSELLTELIRHKPLGTSNATVSVRDWKCALNPGASTPTPRVQARPSGGKAVALAAAAASISAVAFLGMASQQGTTPERNNQLLAQPQSGIPVRARPDASSRRIVDLFRADPQRPTLSSEAPRSFEQHSPPPLLLAPGTGPTAQSQSPTVVNLPTPSLWQDAESQIEPSSSK